MKRQTLITLALIFCTGLSFAQGAKVVSAYNYMRDGDFSSAQKAIDDAVQDEKTGAKAKTWYYRGTIYEALYGDTTFRRKTPNALEEAVKSYQKAMELEPQNQWRDEIAKGLADCAGYFYDEGVAPYNNHDYNAAYNYFKAASDLSEYMNKSFGTATVDTFSTLYAAQAAVKSKKYDDAISLFQALKAKGISRPEMYSNLGTIYLDKGDTAKAKEIIGQGVKAFPQDKSLMVQELNVYLFSKDYNGAISKLKDAIAKDPGFTSLYIQLGSMYEQMKDTADARKTYEEAIAKSPSTFDGYYRLGALYYNQAVDFNNQMNKLDINDQKNYDILKLKRDNLFKKALPYLEKSHQIDAKDMDSMQALKELYARLNMMDKQAAIKKEIENSGH